MPFQIIQGSIPDCRCSAVVNPTDEALSGSGGLDRQIHLAAGPGLREACDAIGRLEIGQSVLTPAYGLACGAIIHTVAPWWSGRVEELEQLRECYRSALRLAAGHGLYELAFPLIGSGTRGFPKEAVLEIAAQEIKRFLTGHDEFDIRLVIHDRGEFRPNARLLEGLERYRRRLFWAERARTAPRADYSTPASGFSARTDSYSAPIANLYEPEEDFYESEDEFIAPTAARQDMPKEPRERPAPQARRIERREKARPARPPERTGLFSRPAKAAAAAPTEAAPKREKTWFAKKRIVLDESFSQMVMRKIDERGFQKDSECYVRANIDRRLFSKIRSDQSYHPKKTTAVALAVALELPLDETRELLEKAGYTLSRSILFDVIVEYCIEQKKYDIFEINELLFQYDQPLLGG